MKTMNKILQSLIFTGLFFGIPATIGWVVFPSSFSWPLLWMSGLVAMLPVFAIMGIFIYGLVWIWK